MELIKTGHLTRHQEFDRAAVDEENRTVRLSFSSEEPVERWFGNEVLSHNPSHVRMDRLEAGAPLLWNHNTDVQVGRVESASIENRRGEAVVRFSKSARGEELYQDVLDGIATNVSVGYRINEMVLDEDDKESETYRAVDWMPHEISLVSVPADYAVGVGREISGDHQTRVFKPEAEKQEVPEMSEEKIDVQAVRDEAREAVLAEEAARIATIQQASKDAPYLRELADKAISDRMPLDAFQLEALEAAKRELKVKPVQESVSAPISVDMSNKERSQYSILKAVQAQMSGNWSDAGLEREVSETIAQREGDTTGFYIPMNAPWGQRDLTAGTNNQGGFLVPTDHRAGDFVEALRANMVAGQAGATYLTGLTGNVAIPKIATGTAVGWVAEGGSVTEGQPVFGSISLTPKNLVGYVEMTRNLMLQSSPAVETVVQQDITNALAVGMDAAALAGSGSSNQPTGILSTSGIGSVSFSSSGAPTFAEIVAIESEITADNAATTGMVYVTTPALNGYLKTATKDSGSGRFISENGIVNGYSVLNTSSVTANNVILGNFSDLIIAQFGAIEVLTKVEPSTGITTLALHLMTDIGVRHAQSFAKGA